MQERSHSEVVRTKKHWGSNPSSTITGHKYPKTQGSQTGTPAYGLDLPVPITESREWVGVGGELGDGQGTHQPHL